MYSLQSSGYQRLTHLHDESTSEWPERASVGSLRVRRDDRRIMTASVFLRYDTAAVLQCVYDTERRGTNQPTYRYRGSRENSDRAARSQVVCFCAQKNVSQTVQCHRTLTTGLGSYLYYVRQGTALDKRVPDVASWLIACLYQRQNMSGNTLEVAMPIRRGPWCNGKTEKQNLELNVEYR
jgi:hypothetical protein